MGQARLMRSEEDRIFGGVCGGIASYLGIDSTIVRLAFVALALASGMGLLIYFVLLIIMPKESSYGMAPSRVVQENLDTIGSDINVGVKKIRQHPQGPTIAAGLLILIGFYLLLDGLGWLPWFNGTMFWALLLISAGVYMILKRGRES